MKIEITENGIQGFRGRWVYLHLSLPLKFILANLVHPKVDARTLNICVRRDVRFN